MQLRRAGRESEHPAPLCTSATGTVRQSQPLGVNGRNAHDNLSSQPDAPM